MDEPVEPPDVEDEEGMLPEEPPLEPELPEGTLGAPPPDEPDPPDEEEEPEEEEELPLDGAPPLEEEDC